MQGRFAQGALNFHESLAPRYSLGLRVLKLPKVKEGAVNNVLGAAILPFGTQDAEEFTASRNGQEAGMYLSGIQLIQHQIASKN